MIRNNTIYILFGLLLFSYNLFGQDAEKPTVALLGTFHFAGSNDLMAMKFDDLKSDKRQAEIKEMVAMLEEFKPTKVILEYPYGNQKLDSVYGIYLKGERGLSINERQQLGFRLAEAMGHQHIFVADSQLDLPFDVLIKFLEQEGRMQEFQELIEKTKEEVIVKSEEYLKEHTIAEYFVFLNQESSDLKNRNFYIQHALGYNSEDNDIGIRLVTAWWERNFRIMANIEQIIEPGDRVLILFGQGHTSILKDLYKGRDDLEYEEITDYLK